jgi:hypothetical protein
VSIDGTITIFYYTHYFVSREWLWVAITRATELDNVYFYNCQFDKEFHQKLIHSYFERKIRKYKSQDRESRGCPNRKFNNHVNVDWFMKAAPKRCCNCHCNFDISFDTGNTYSNITADRLDNSQDHNLNHIQVMWRSCNTCKSDLQNE